MERSYIAVRCIAPCSVTSLVIWRKRFAERPKQPPFWRPICDCKYYASKRSAEIVLKSMPKVDSCAMGIVAEGPTAPMHPEQAQCQV